MVDDASGDRDGTADGETSVSDPDAPADDTTGWPPSSDRTDSTGRAGGASAPRESAGDDRRATDAPEAVGRADTAESESDGGRIPLDLSGDSGSDSSETTDGDDDADDPYAPEPSSTPIEAGDPDLENAIFVVLGAIAMILVFVRLASLPM